MRGYLLIAAILLNLLNCVTPRPTKKVFNYGVEYNVILVEVEQVGSSLNGKIEKDKFSENTYNYIDNFINSSWSFEKDRISFELENLTNKSIKINWDDSAIIDFIDNKSIKITHSDIKYSEINNRQKPTVVARKSSISDFVIPVNRIYIGNRVSYNEITGFDFFDEWQHHPLVWFQSISITQNSNILEIPPIPKEYLKHADIYKNERMGLLLSIETNNAIKEYIFWFEVTGYQVMSIQSKEVSARRGNAEPENTDAFSIEQMAVSEQSKKNEQEKPPTIANMSSKNRQPEVDTNTEDMKNIMEELIEDEKPTYIAIKKVLNKYILLYQGKETPMVIEDEYLIVRRTALGNFLTIGTAKVVKIKGSVVALKPNLKSRYQPVTLLDTVEYVRK